MLYAMGNMSFCSIARRLGVSDVAVLKWVRNQARRLPEPAVTAETVIITLDEMGHFLKTRLASLGLARV
jgi:transposase-like protein